MVVLFFFQAEDGIRDLIVTGVQTCALPISIPMTVSATGSIDSGIGTIQGLINAIHFEATGFDQLFSFKGVSLDSLLAGLEATLDDLVGVDRHVDGQLIDGGLRLAVYDERWFADALVTSGYTPALDGNNDQLTQS